MKRVVIMGAGAVLLAGLAAGPAVAAKGKPDAFIKVNGYDFVGKNVYSPPATIDDQSVETSGDGTFTVRVKNRGTKTDSLKIHVSLGTFLDGTTQIFYKGSDVTAKAEAGDLRLKNVAPGRSSKPLTIENDVTATSGSTASASVDVFSTKKSTAVDAVRAVSVQS